MRHICSRCKLTSADGNLWCQEIDCPAGTLPALLRYGDYLGNLKIIQLKRVLRNTTIYKAERSIDDKRVETFFLKVANPGAENEQYLCEEAAALQRLCDGKAVHPALPVWRHHGATNGQDPFGIVSLRDQTRFYYLMDYIEGEFLYDTLLDNPQPWHEHVGWFMIALCEALYYFQSATGKLHLNLNPDVILVRRNNAGVIQPVLLDMGLQLAPDTLLLPANVEQYQRHLLPAYTAPELIGGGRLTPMADVWALGLILYEMLAGKPAYPYALRRTEDIYADIQKLTPVLRRVDLPRTPRGGASANGHVVELVEVVQRAIRADHPKRYQDVSELRNALYTLYGETLDRPKTDFASLAQRAGMIIAVGAGVLFVLYILFVLISALLRGAG
ncbi:MAG TPA: protein kinase [Oceanobacillus sp.]|nr:protein kinase [Oceanobacillus sp.]